MRWWHWLGHPFDNTCRGRVLGQNHETEQRWLGGSILSTPAKKNGRGDGGGWWCWSGHPFDNMCRGQVLSQNPKTEQRWLGFGCCDEQMAGVMEEVGRAWVIRWWH